MSDSKGFQRMFAPGRLTVGVFFPIESFEHDDPTMRNQENRVTKLTEASGRTRRIRRLN